MMISMHRLVRFLLSLLVLGFLYVASAHSEPGYAGPTYKGEWRQGGIILGQTTPGSAVVVDGKAVLVSPEGDFVFGIGRNHTAPVSIKTSHPKSGSVIQAFEVASREYRIQRIEGVKQKHVTPPKSVLERISKEAKKVRRARTREDKRVDFTGAFIWPAKGPLTGVYGSQRVYNGVPKSPHYGVDIASPTGTPVIAPAPGIISLVEPDLYYSGGTLILDHGHGLSSTFIHLSAVSVELGQRVEQGEKIGEIGATGRATGPHLDWRMNWFKVRVDPQLLMGDSSPND